MVKGKDDDDLPDIDKMWEELEAVSGRPTVAPPFDLETYAKDAADSPGEPAPGGPATRPVTDTALTAPPPPLAPPVSQKEPFSQRQTLPGTARAEAARAHDRAGPPPRKHSLLAFADSRTPSEPPPGEGPTPEAEHGDEPAPKSEGTALDLVAQKAEADPSRGRSSDPVMEMRERFTLGDYSGALVMAESLLEDNPTHSEAREYAESCRSVLQQMYTARIGPLDRVPMVEVARDQLRWLSIDHRAGFMLSLVDGVSSLEMILDVSGMPTLDALRILYELVQQRIVSFR